MIIKVTTDITPPASSMKDIQNISDSHWEDVHLLECVI